MKKPGRAILEPTGTPCFCCRRPSTAERPVLTGRSHPSASPRTLCKPCLADPANAYVDCRHGDDTGPELETRRFVKRWLPEARP